MNKAELIRQERREQLTQMLPNGMQVIYCETQKVVCDKIDDDEVAT